MAILSPTEVTKLVKIQEQLVIEAIDECIRLKKSDLAKTKTELSKLTAESVMQIVNLYEKANARGSK